MTECNHSLKQICRYIQTNGIRIVVSQCLTCGKNLGAKPKSDFKIEELPDWDGGIAAEWAAARSNDWQQKRDAAAQQCIAEQEFKTGEWWGKYGEYLHSEHWRKLRLIVLNRDVLCQACLKLRSQEVHHLSYASYNKWGMSFSVECVGLCAACHAQIHDKENHGLA